MIARYSRKAMAEIWSENAKYLSWLRVEYAVSAALASANRIPRADWSKLKKSLDRLIASGGVSPKRVEKLESRLRHDVIAFTAAVAERVRHPTSRWFHFGLTSSDVVDTALALRLVQSVDLLLGEIKNLKRIIRKRAIEFKGLPTIGRTHGMHAEPTSFGLKFLGWYTELERNEERLMRASAAIAFGKLTGAVGASPHWNPAFESKVLRKLGLSREPVSTQVIPRDRHAELLNAVAICGAGLERMAVELRHLQRSEVGEVLEGFSKGQKGSSAMPHKRNPISSENLTGCARLLRAYAGAAMEDIALWHERDISHSAVERVALADALILFDYMLSRASRLMADLEVRRDSVTRNLKNAGPGVYSGRLLLELVKNGVKREEAYGWVQDCALHALDTGRPFTEIVVKDQKISRALKLSPEKIRNLTSIEAQLIHVPAIYREAL